MRKLVSFLLAFAMIFSLVVPAYAVDSQNPTISVTADKKKIAAGEEIVLTVSIDKSFTDLNNYQFNLYYNPELFEFKSAVKGDACALTSFGVSIKDDFGKTYIPITALDTDGLAISLDAGTVATLTFTAKEAVEGYGEFAIDAKEIIDYNTFDNYSVNATVNNVTVTVGNPPAVGPVIPDTAPFSAVTADIVGAITVEECGSVSLNPFAAYGGQPYAAKHYHVTVPEGTTEVYIRYDNGLAGFTSQSFVYPENAVAAVYASVNHESEDDYESGMSELRYVEAGDDYTLLAFPLPVFPDDMGQEYSAIKTYDEEGEELLYYAVGPGGPESTGGIVSEVFTFEYVEAVDEDAHTITVVKPDGGTVMADKTTAIAGAYVNLTYTPDKGYRFKYFLINGVVSYLENGVLQMPDADVTVSAVFESTVITTYTVATTEYTNGTVTADKAAAASGDTVTLTVTPDAHYVLDTLTYTTAEGTVVEINQQTKSFAMPAANVTVNATFRKETYAITVNPSENGTVTANPETAASGDTVTLTVAPATNYTLDTLSVMQGETPVSVSANQFQMPEGPVSVTATFKKMADGYRFATSADAPVGDDGIVSINVKITGHSDPSIASYNAYDVTLNFDSSKLALLQNDDGYVYGGAVKSDDGRIEVGDGTVRIVGAGATKGFDEILATLYFQPVSEMTGNTTVTVGKVQVSEQKDAIAGDAPEAIPQHKEDDPSADDTPDEIVIKVPHPVTKDTWLDGNAKVVDGEKYTFWFKDNDETHYTNTVTKITVGGVEIDIPTPNAEGKYILENVNGAVVIESAQQAKEYAVSYEKDNDVTVTPSSEKAVYGTDYSFAVAAGEGKDITSVTVTKGSNINVEFTSDGKGNYTIYGTDITGDLKVTIVQSTPTVSTTVIEFVGINADEVNRDLINTVPNGEDFTFVLNIADCDYTVAIGDAPMEAVEGTYTIPGTQINGTKITVTVTKTAQVKVVQYVKLAANAEEDTGSSMFLVMAKMGSSVLKYGDVDMYYSEQYALSDKEGAEKGVYCYLVVSSERMENVLEAAKTAISRSESTTPTILAYDYDVNGSTKVDINDAQLIYDMAMGSYRFTTALTVEKFLKADTNFTGELNVQDVVAVVSYIASGLADQ